MPDLARVIPFGYLGYKVVGPFGNEIGPIETKEAADQLAASMNETVGIPHEHSSLLDPSTPEP